jgi:RNA polymerase sigma factor (sigma-70 family)
MSADAEPIETLLGHAGWLRRLAFALVRDPDAAADVAQGTLIAAWKHPPTAGAGEHAGDDPRPWLRQVARRNAQDQRRGERRREAREAAAVALQEPAAASPEQLLGDLELHRAVAEAVTALEPPYREVVMLRYFEGQTAAEVARRLEVPAGTVRWRLREGLARVRVALDARYGGDRRRWVAALAPLLPLVPELGPALGPMSETALLASGVAAAPGVSAAAAGGTRAFALPAVLGAAVGLVAAVVLITLFLLDLLRAGVSADGAPAAPAVAREPAASAARRLSSPGRAAAAPPRFAVTAPGEASERLEGVASEPEEILRRMLAAVETNAYDDFLHAASDRFKALLPPRHLARLARDLGPRLARGYTAASFGRLTRRAGVDYLWKLTLADGGDDLLVRLTVTGDQVAGFLIQ